MTQPTSPVQPGLYNSDVALDTGSEAYLSTGGAGATTLFGNGTGPGGAAVSMIGQNDTLGAQNAGFTIDEDQQEQSVVSVTGTGATIQGKVLIGNAAYEGTFPYSDNFDLYAPSAGAITIGGSLPGEGNTFGGSAAYLAIVDGTTADVAGNLFNGNAEFFDLDVGAQSTIIQGNTFVGSVSNIGGGAIQGNRVKEYVTNR